MNLIFKEKYLSIDKFKTIKFPNFTVLTGINGSGKSHLLESIQEKKTIIENYENANVIYFNYETFKLENETEYTDHQILSQKNEAYAFFERQIRRIILSAKIEFLGKKYEKIIDICTEKQKNLWLLSQEEINDQHLYEGLQKYNHRILTFLNRNNQNNENSPAILALWKSAKYCISDIEKAQFFAEYKPYSFKSDFLPQQLGKIIWDYYIKYRHNLVNAWENYTNGSAHPVISEAEFIKKHGDKPWELINTILDKFNALDYKVNSPSGLSASDTFKLKLMHNTKNLEVEFERLSSGEKVLMALVTSIYKSASDNHFPDILLLDEIDASLHPSMIKNLFEVIQDIFLKKNIKVILVTHSPTTVALAPDESIFVMNKEGLDRVEKKSKEVALSILSEGFVTLSQNESDLSISYSISKTPKDILLTEGITDKIIIETAWKKLFPKTEMPFYIQDCFDAAFLAALLKRGAESPDGLFMKYLDKRFIALFDFDATGFSSWNALWNTEAVHTELDPRKGLAKKHPSLRGNALLLPVPNHHILEKQVIKNNNETFKDKAHLQIELLFYHVSSLQKHFKEENSPGGGTLIKFIGDKRRFAEDCENLVPSDFDSFKILFESIQKTLRACN